MSIKHVSILSAVAAAALLSACGAMMSMALTFSQEGLPAAVMVPKGNVAALESVGVGELTYECRDKANAPAHNPSSFTLASRTVPKHACMLQTRLTANVCPLPRRVLLTQSAFVLPKWLIYA